MEPKEYSVTRIEGEYAYLRDEDSGAELFIALALLPPDTDVGVRLHYDPCEGYSVRGAET